MKVKIRSVVVTEDLATVTDQFICKNCGIWIEDFSKVIFEEYDDGYVDKLYYEYRFKFCPECGAKIKGEKIHDLRNMRKRNYRRQLV